MAWRRGGRRQRDEIPSHHLPPQSAPGGAPEPSQAPRPMVIGHASGGGGDRMCSTAGITLAPSGGGPTPAAQPVTLRQAPPGRQGQPQAPRARPRVGVPEPTGESFRPDVAPSMAGQSVQYFGGTSYVPAAAPAPVVEAPKHPKLESEDARIAQEKVLAMGLPMELMLQYKKKFDVLDLNKDGVVSLREFAAVSRVLGYKFTRDECKEIFGERDIDDSGGITFDEFVCSMQERRRRAAELNPLKAKFRVYDLANRGFITADECYPVLKRELGFDMNKTESFVDLFDKNRNYRLGMTEFPEFQTKVDELKGQVMAAFQDFDRDGDGYVDVNEMLAVLGPKGFTPDQVQVLIQKHDSDGDARLNYSEFAAFWDIPIF